MLVLALVSNEDESPARFGEEVSKTVNGKDDSADLAEFVGVVKTWASSFESSTRIDAAVNSSLLR